MTLAELKTMFEAEIKCASSEILGKSSETSLFDALNKPVSYNPKKLLKNEIFCVKNAVKRPWQTVLFSVYPTVPRIWEVLEDNDKKEFLEDYYSLWLSYLAAFPIDNAYKIYSLLKSGQLTIYRGLKDVTYDPQSGIFTAKLEDQNLHASYLINATGQGHDITQSNSPLLQNLLQNNYIQPHLLGGIEVDFITLRAISVDKVLPLFIVGDSTWGACMATADLAQLVTNQIPRLINSMLAPYRPSAISSRSNSPIHTRPASSFASNKTEGRQHDDSVDQSFRRQY
jgi:uncharacterized NAD(P)/FAD-binding protein YdhS